MKIIRAEKMGFCFGVKEAVNLVESVVKENGGKKIYMLGMLVHNKVVIADLEKKGVATIEENEISSLNEDDVVIIRAHGITKEILHQLEQRKVKIYDATCVFVTKIKKVMIKKIETGYKPVIVGDKNHPEVRGIISFADNVDVVADYEEFKEKYKNSDEKISVLAQTTLNKNVYEDLKASIKNEYKNAVVEETICGATYERQKAVEKLAGIADIVLVIGGKNSSNTKKLFNISKEINENTYFVENKEDIKSEWLQGKECVGITAGTSTPENSIKEVEEFILSI